MQNSFGEVRKIHGGFIPAVRIVGKKRPSQIKAKPKMKSKAERPRSTTTMTKKKRRRRIRHWLERSEKPSSKMMMSLMMM